MDRPSISWSSWAETPLHDRVWRPLASPTPSVKSLAARGIRTILPLQRRTRVVALLLPRRLWFPSILRLGRLHGSLRRLVGLDYNRMQVAMMQDHWLTALTQLASFPIHWRITGTDCIEQAKHRDKGVLLCGVHLPFYGVSVRAVTELGLAIDLAIADPGNIAADGTCLRGGMQAALPALPVTNALFSLKSALRRNQVAMSLLDPQAGAELSPVLLRLAGRLGATVILGWCELEPNGVLHLTYQPAPCDTEANVQSALAVIRDQRRRIFATLDKTL